MSTRASSSTNTFSGRWLLLARATWAILAVIILGLDVAGIPYAYARYMKTCTSAACADSGRLTPEGIQDLQQLGISPQFYAAYVGVGLAIIVALVFFAVAAVIYWRRSNDRMAMFASFTLLIFGGAAINDLAGAHPAFQFPADLLIFIGQVSFVVFFYIFPDGRFEPRWTRWLALTVALLYIPDIFFPGSALDFLDGPLFFVFIASLVFAQVYRYVRVWTPAQRQQTKWVVFGFSTALAGFLGTILLYEGVPAIGRSGPLGELVAETVVYGFLLLIPLSIGMAILRSRLYDIDVIINRALVYGALTAMLAAIYLGGVAATQAILDALTGQARQPSSQCSLLFLQSRPCSCP